MSINRVGHIFGPQQLAAKHEHARQTLDMVLQRTPVMLELERYRREHPGEQPYLLVLDTTMQIVRDLMRHLPGLSQRLAAGEAAARAEHGGQRPDVALWIQMVPRDAGVQVARFLAKDEPMVQAMCDHLVTADAMAICLAGIGMVMTDLVVPSPGDLAAAERERRAARRRSAGR